jgi:mannose-6-phosphate isomerase-like protein (cupin superfamily)
MTSGSCFFSEMEYLIYEYLIYKEKIMHFVGKFDETALEVPPGYEQHSQGYTRLSLADYSNGPVHTGRGVCQLEPGGSIDLHVHSYEEGFYVMSGAVLLSLDGHNYVLGPGDYGIIQIGLVHGFRNVGSVRAQWQDMLAPQPKAPDQEPDTFFLQNGNVPQEGERPDLKDPTTRFLGHFEDSQLPPGSKLQMAGAEGGNIHGVSIKMMLDRALGAQHLTMFIVEFGPGGEGVVHDHPYEESYFILSGEAVGLLDNQEYKLKAGDFAFSSVGGYHGFFNRGTVPVRWIETQSPQPPDQQAFRFEAQWRYLSQKYGNHEHSHDHGHSHDHEHGHNH